MKKLIEKQNKEFDKKFDNSKEQLYEYDKEFKTWTSCYLFISKFNLKN